ncbi:MAG: LLM class flavin-dependent oxidoreductase, partial [Solirubrobacterales bacterium]|nr:LLM class flavin-dependent oxidoreductase [Solirubrobacterales bacterium]
EATLAGITDHGSDHVCIGDHVSFFVGVGWDALIAATSLLTHYEELPVYVGLYPLPLRHPVLVARQLASIAELAPGRPDVVRHVLLLKTDTMHPGCRTAGAEEDWSPAPAPRCPPGAQPGC